MEQRVHHFRISSALAVGDEPHCRIATDAVGWRRGQRHPSDAADRPRWRLAGRRYRARPVLGAYRATGAHQRIASSAAPRGEQERLRGAIRAHLTDRRTVAGKVRPWPISCAKAPHERYHQFPRSYWHLR